MHIKINYEKITNEFNKDLVDKLRLHGSDKEYIKLWVPDENFIRSLESLIEALSIEGYTELELEVNKKLISLEDKELLKKLFKDILIDEHKNQYLLKIKNINSFITKKIIKDKVKETTIDKIEYEYGSYSITENENKIKKYLKYYFTKINKNKKSILNKSEMMKFEIEGINVYFCLSHEKKLKNIYINSSKKQLVASIHIFKRLFNNKSLSYIGKNGINEYIYFLRKQNLINIKGIILPFNLGQEIVFIHKICQFFLLNYGNSEDELFIKKPKDDWIKLDLNEKKRRCKNELNSFLSVSNLDKDLIFLDDIQKDLYDFEVRIFVNFKDNSFHIDKPKQTRNLEMFLKDRIDRTLQVFYKEKKDLSKIRRL